jgi:hypothetical protein
MRMPDFRRSAGAALILCLALAPVAAVGEGTAAAKPLPPVSLSWQVDSTAAADGVYGVALNVLARAPFPDLTVEVALPPGFEALEGSLRWTGPMAKDETRTIQVRVRAPAPGRVTARVSGKTASNVQFTRTVGVDVPEPENPPTEAGKPAPEEGGASASPTPGIHELPSR